MRELDGAIDVVDAHLHVGCCCRRILSILKVKGNRAKIDGAEARAHFERSFTIRLLLGTCTDVAVAVKEP